MTTVHMPDKPLAAGPLPTPADRPQADVVIYDGQCRFCTGQVARLDRWDRAGRFAYLSLHDPEVARRYPDLDHDDLMRNMVVVEPSGRRHRGAEAVRYFTRVLPRLWWAAPVLHLPGTLPLWQWLYGKVAKTRYRWGRIESCDNGTCRLPGR